MSSSSHSPAGPLFALRDLRLCFHTRNGRIEALRGLDLELWRGQTLALVGLSGSGKSVGALAALRLLPPSASYEVTGSAVFDGEELLSAPEHRLRALRGARIAYVFQEPMTALDPMMTVGRQMRRAILQHQRLSDAEVRQKSLSLLDEVGIAGGEERLTAQPHELSGGQRQRILLAMAIANEPDLLIADEPTTALDVTIQAQILALLKELQHRRNMAMLFISHDLDVVAHMANHIAVMEHGRIVETGLAAQLLTMPQHPLTKALVAARPKPRPPRAALAEAPLLRARDLKICYQTGGGFFQKKREKDVVKGLSFELYRGRTLALVGESGSGKSTTAMALAGQLKFKGEILAPSLFARDIQVVFQDPYGALSPRMRIFDIVAEGLLIQKLPKAEIRARVEQAMRDVDMPQETLLRFPSELSGGQRQRIALARALVQHPKVVILDEPTSALDQPVQAKILNLINEIQDRYGLAYLFISHNLAAVSAVADDLAVMRQGEIVEYGRAEDVLARPQHPYSQELLAAAFTLAKNCSTL